MTILARVPGTQVFRDVLENPDVRAVLEREGTVERLGCDHLHGNVHRGVEAQRKG